MWRNWNHCAPTVGLWTGAATVENSRRVFKTLKIEFPHDLAIPLLGIYTKALQGTQTDICTPRFKAALITISKKRKQPKCSSGGEWTDKMWYRHIRDAIQAEKGRESRHLPQHMPSEVKRSQRARAASPLTWGACALRPEWMPRPQIALNLYVLFFPVPTYLWWSLGMHYTP